MNAIMIRKAKIKDAGKIRKIYAYYVEHTAITFEYKVPSFWQFRKRMKHVMKKYPCLVAERDGKIVGFAYASSFHEREAYGWCVETTIYLAQDAVKCGTGKLLYDTLAETLKKMGILNLYACIAVPKSEDEYLTNNSAQFHEHLGFTKIGHFSQCGYKFNRWYDMIWMEKQVGEHKEDQEPVYFYKN